MKSLSFTILLTLQISLLSYAQRDYQLIDHTARSNTFNAIQLTDSVIYYSLQDYDFLSGNSTFNSIDSAGIKSSQVVWNGSSKCKFIPQGDHHIKAFYYELYEGDFGTTGIYQLDKNGDQINISFHDIYKFNVHDLEFNENNDIVLLENQKLSFYNSQDLLLVQIDFPFDQNTYFVRNKNEIYIATQNIIYHLNGYTLNPVYNSTENMFKVLSSEQDELYIVYDNEIKKMNTIDLSVSDLLTYDLPQKTEVEYNGRQEFIFTRTEGDKSRFTHIDNSGIPSSLYESAPGESFTHVRLVDNQLYLNGHRSQSPVTHTYFKKTSIDNTNDSAICVDAIIRYAEIEHVAKTFHYEVPTPFGPDTVFRYDYTYLITLENNDTDSINRLDIYSSTFEQGGFANYRNLHFTVEDLGPAEIRTITGDLLYYSSRGKIEPNLLYLSGANYLLDCDTINNTYDVSNIVSSTIGLKPIESLTMFPNPTNNYIHISSKSSLPYSIHSPEGKTILQGVFKEKIDVSELSPGLYFLNIEGEIKQFIKL